MNKLDWKIKYIKRLMDHGLSHSLAESTFEASDEIDYTDDPADSADEELSYWGDGV